MPRERSTGGPADRDRMEHMLTAARAATGFITGRARADIDIDDMLRRALINAVQEIGEAAARVTDAGRSRAPGVPWARSWRCGMFWCMSIGSSTRISYGKSL